MLRDSQYRKTGFRISEIEHGYGPRVHILSDLVLQTQLARLCSKATTQPWIGFWVESIYRSLLSTVMNHSFAAKPTEVMSRMADAHPQEGCFEVPLLDPKVQVVVVDLVRAGMLPSHTCYSMLNHLMDPALVRQDHISISRATDAKEQVLGASVSGHKIGGRVDDAILVIPDPMGATGGTVCEAIQIYRTQFGKPKKILALHCIVTPEYLKRVLTADSEVEIYAVRLDRGLSSSEVLDTMPGTHWSKEKGLNDRQYIVPGGGGFGEILNNAYV